MCFHEGAELGPAVLGAASHGDREAGKWHRLQPLSWSWAQNELVFPVICSCSMKYSYAFCVICKSVS